MLRHIVLSTFKSDATEAQLDAWRKAVTEMCEASDEVVSFTLGANIGSGPNHHDSALVADFKDLESFRAYIASPAHKAYVEDHAKHVVEKLAAVQHEL
jgi:antibiotic biosynthesis monooxygenase (ABM) superfamily enzyme